MSETKPMSGEEMLRLTRDHVLVSWSAQASANPLPITRAEGIYMWDASGKRYIDFSAQLMCNQLGHGYQKAIKKIQAQLEKIQFLHPAHAHESKARLARMIVELAPGPMQKVLFTNGGADAIENAMKMARMVTGRHKLLARYRSYHGATYGSGNLGGDPRRLGVEPGITGVVHFTGPFPYRCPFGSKTDAECTERSLAHLQQVIEFEGPGTIAAIFLEGVSGSSGIYTYPAGYMEGVRRLCDKYDILLVIDEVMSGFCRTGKWFGCQNYDARPDMITMAKGLTAAYAPLGAVAVSKRIADHFENNVMLCGLTYSGHPLSCAAGVAAIEAYQEEKILDHVREMSKVQVGHLEALKAKHKSVGEFRNLGLFGVIECVKDRATREPMAPFNAKAAEMGVMAKVGPRLKELGMITFVRWNMIFCVPPLVITKDQLDESFAMIDDALSIVDQGYTGK